MRGALVRMAITLVGSVVLAAVDAGAATNHSGPILANETWTAAGNPHILTGDVTVGVGLTLTIEPGVIALVTNTDDTFSGHDSGRVELIVAGGLAANGTASGPVSITPENPTGQVQWHGIRILQGTQRVDVRLAIIGGAAS